MASDGEGLTELCLEDWWWATDHQAVLDSNRESDREPDVFRMTRVWLTAYFAGERPGLDQTPPLHPAGTPFQHEVWNLVAEIPYGMTVSYGELAAELAERRGGGRMAAQAVGGAVKRNPVTILELFAVGAVLLDRAGQNRTIPTMECIWLIAARSRTAARDRKTTQPKGICNINGSRRCA